MPVMVRAMCIAHIADAADDRARHVARRGRADRTLPARCAASRGSSPSAATARWRPRCSDACSRACAAAGPDSTGLGLYDPASNGHYVVRVWCGDDHAAADAARVRAAERIRHRGLRLRLRRAALPCRRGDPGRRHLPRGGGRRRARRGVLGRPVAADLQARHGRRGARPRLRPRGLARPARRRPHAPRHRVAHRRAARPPVLGPAVRRHLRRAQRPHHELPQAPPPLRDEGATASSPATTPSCWRCTSPHRLEEGATIQRGHGGLDPRPRRRVLLPARDARRARHVPRPRRLDAGHRGRDRRLGRRRVGADRRPPGLRRGGRAGVVPRARRRGGRRCGRCSRLRRADRRARSTAR